MSARGGAQLAVRREQARAGTAAAASARLRRSRSPGRSAALRPAPASRSVDGAVAGSSSVGGGSKVSVVRRARAVEARDSSATPDRAPVTRGVTAAAPRAGACRAPRTGRRNRWRSAIESANPTRSVAVVAHREPLIGRAAPQEDRARDVQQCPSAARCRPSTIDVRVGQVDRRAACCRRARWSRAAAAARRSAAARGATESGCRRGTARPAPPARGADVAVAVDHDERVAV